MIRKAFVMTVLPDAHDEYQRRHDELWPEMASHLKRHGVSNYSIFLNPGTSQLFAYVELESEARWEALSETKICRRWWLYMKDIMRTEQDGKPLTDDLQQVFHLA
ncbi:L-rhamnose mutarotase [Endozoicomonas sp. OPT23]|uniref:L-rhamnose mutarotase n=1 Tax=Endozoicomonas sp. OPT23 TaxID=2072845 RepID=UPI00129B7196|nr:L-rhamnose mutarotase [Endozoicomonas sp. OPT23]MRI31514.1 L-rhamnose mutarotase [Endozoicomonas sp. OPT23]